MTSFGVRFRTTVRVVAIALLLVASAAGAGFAWLKYSHRRTPVGQPPLSSLDAETLPAFREAFNATHEVTRVVVFFSPT
jgi:hypothetical protein